MDHEPSRSRPTTDLGGFAGFLQPLGIYLAMIGLFAAVQRASPGLRDHRYPLQGEVAALLAIAASLALGRWHHRRGRRRMATGVYVGTAAWPLFWSVSSSPTPSTPYHKVSSVT